MADLKELENEVSILIQRQQKEIKPTKPIEKDFVDQGWPKEKQTQRLLTRMAINEHGRIRLLRRPENIVSLAVEEHGRPFTNMAVKEHGRPFTNMDVKEHGRPFTGMRHTEPTLMSVEEHGRPFSIDDKKKWKVEIDID